ncbi:hypothetical protein [Nocardioides caricicola]|uniref:DUF2238 domain-containing protein n=1 Tax=Nocardioides caricicola TaxID=634770 RepID=A0ABW0N772_9ACTN
MTIQVPQPAGRTDAGRLVAHHEPRPLLAAVTISLKVLVVLAMIRVATDPDWANLDGKAPVARAILFPVVVLALPTLWAVTRRSDAYPWVADLLVTLTVFGDVVGNRLDLYDAVTWFDDAMHLANAAMVSAAYVVLTVARPASPAGVAHTAVAAGLTASLAWELFEYGSFLTRSTEWSTAYSDTVGDLTLGWLGSVLAAAVLVIARRGSSGTGGLLSRTLRK